MSRYQHKDSDRYSYINTESSRNQLIHLSDWIESKDQETRAE